jgi:hypothetical protein
MKFSDLTICYCSKFFRRLGNDRGVAMLYTAVITMFILALFSLIHDVGRISEDKMQMQGAADAAALEFATWQARGMNTVQNLNQEMYDIDNLVITMYCSAALLSYASQPLKGFFGVGYILEGVSAGLFYGGVYLHHVIGVGMLQTLRHFYAYGSNILAYLAANEIAALNGADPILPDMKNLVGGRGGKLGEMIADLINLVMQKIHVICVPTTLDTMFTLPLKIEEGKNLPLNISVPKNKTPPDVEYDHENATSDAGLPGAEDRKKEIKDAKKTDYSESVADEIDYSLDTIVSIALAAIMAPAVKANTFTCFLNWDFFTWSDNYYRSSDKYNDAGYTSLPPVVAVVCKKQNPGLISRYLLQANSPIPVMAYAVARCEGGNVVAYCGDSNSTYRDGTHGVSASAVLVPFSKISEVWAEQSNSSEISGFMEFMNSVFLH